MSIAKKFSKILNPQAWHRLQRSYLERCRAARLREQVEANYRIHGPLSSGNGAQTVVADGMWDNPNHFFRLHLFLKALPGIENYRLLGVIRHKRDRTRQTLEAFGFREFIFIEEHQFKTEDFLPQARTLLEKVRTHADLLNLDLPLGLPPYTYYDTVLKYARDPQPPLTDPLWLSQLAETLRDLAIYQQLMDEYEVTQVVLSHPWKIEFATLMWTALQHRIPSYHLTGFCEGIRVRRLLQPADYATPVEHVPYREYAALPQPVRERLRRTGLAYLAQRETGDSSDINVCYSFRPAARIDTHAEAKLALGGQPSRPMVIIYAHVWFDFPHTYAMRNFTDFLDWMRFTMAQIHTIKSVDWVLKPHPLESWYGGTQLAKLIGELPSHIRLIPADTDSLTSMLAADAIVTVHGTIALEAAAHGLCVIAADRSYYSDWGFAHIANSREHYAQLLASVVQLSAPTESQKEDALACMALSLAPPPVEMDAINLRCDSSGSILYRDMLGRGTDEIDREILALRRWLQGTAVSYAAHRKILHCGSTP